MSIDLNQALEYAVAWAKEVGKIQLSYFRGNDLGIQTKSNVYDVVTRADKESEAFLLDKIQKHYPGHAVFGRKRCSCRYCRVSVGDRSFGRYE